MKRGNERQLKETGALMMAYNQSIAVAESVTSGLLQHAFGSMEHASLFYHGGITVYNIGQKSKQLNVGPIHALQVNCVSEKVAIEMAIGVIHMFKSDWGIGITGYASPVPESGGALFAYFAIAFAQQTVYSGKLVPDQPDPTAAKNYYVQKILEQLTKALKERQ